jgi:uncharacterized radical SAM protein YgiQ
LRYDLLVAPEAEAYLKEICAHHVSGQMKVAPEHTEDQVLRLMNKPAFACYEAFVRQFEKVNRTLPSRRYLVNYFITAHPGCSLDDAYQCAATLSRRKMQPEQIQDFIPLPMTVSGCLYYTGQHPMTGETVFIPRSDGDRMMQRALLQPQNDKSAPLIRRALRILGRVSIGREKDERRVSQRRRR